MTGKSRRKSKGPPSEAQIAARAAGAKRLKAAREKKKNPEPVSFETEATSVSAPGPQLGPEGAEIHPLDLVPREQARQVRGDTMRQGTGRQKRKPLGVPVQRLQADVPLGMTGRWTNDTPGRIQRALEGGYEFISSDGDVVQDRSGCRSEIVGTGRDGGAMRAYLMAIPTVLYEEDQAAKAALNKERMSAIKRGTPQQVADQDEKAFYTPSEGIILRDEVR